MRILRRRVSLKLPTPAAAFVACDGGDDQACADFPRNLINGRGGVALHHSYLGAFQGLAEFAAATASGAAGCRQPGESTMARRRGSSALGSITLKMIKRACQMFAS